MEMNYQTVTPHPRLKEQLFSTRKASFPVFNDLLGLLEIDYLSITLVDASGQLQVLSSMPSLDYNLFSSHFWVHDKTFAPEWFCKERFDSWQNLYSSDYYDDLYDIKQLKPRLPLGFSAAIRHENCYFLISLGSHKNCAKAQAVFSGCSEQLIRIGLFCANRLKHLFLGQRSEQLISLED